MTEISEQLVASGRPGGHVVIADMTDTTFCDALSISMLVLANPSAGGGGQLPLRPCASVLCIVNALGVDDSRPTVRLRRTLSPAGRSPRCMRRESRPKPTSASWEGVCQLSELNRRPPADCLRGGDCPNERQPHNQGPHREASKPVPHPCQNRPGEAALRNLPVLQRCQPR